MKIPSNKLWTQTNQGEVAGILHETYNMNFDALGQAQLARRPVSVYTSVSDANLKYLMALVYFSGSYKAITSDSSEPVFQGSLDGGAWSNNTVFTPSCGLNSDAIIFKDSSTIQLIVSQNTALARWDGGFSVNLSAVTGLTAGVPHPLAIFDSQTSYKLAVGDANTVKTYNDTYTVNPTVLTIASQFQVTTMRYRNGYLYIGTKHLYGGEARVFIWNGSGTNAQYECPVGAEWVYAMTEYQDSVAVVTSSGQILKISGVSAVPIANFPVYYQKQARWQNGGATLIGKVFNRGIRTVGDKIYINIDGSVDTGFVPEMKSGIWVYDPDMGLYHRGTASTNAMVGDTTFTVSGETLTTTATHNLKTGDAVSFSAVSGISGIKVKDIYYVTVTGTNTIKLSQSKDALVRGNYQQLSGTVAGDTFNYFPNTDNGYMFGATSGAIGITTNYDTVIPLLSSEIIWGSRTKNEAGTAVYTLNVFAESNNIGSLTTQRIYTDNVEQSWKELYTFLDNIVTTNDDIVVKIQTKYQPTMVELNGTWVSSTVLNSTNSYNKTAWLDFEVGDEVVFVDGKGQGKTAHVVSVESSSSVVSLTLDEAYGVAGQTVDLYRTNFKKVGTYGVDNKGNEFIKVALNNITSPWIKIKCELRGCGTTVNMFELANSIQKGTQ